MQTPFDNFELKITSDVDNLIGGRIVTGVELVHKTLPIVIREVSYDCSKLPVSKLTQNVYRLLFQIYEQGKAQTIQQRHLVRPIHPSAKLGYIYSPEWDKEIQSWFILNEHNEKVYE